MKIEYTVEDLKNFEIEIGECFRQKLIRSPIHLSDGTEEEIIKIFSQINNDDFICCSWRSHYQCLLKGVPKERLKRDIIQGRSIALCYPEYKIFSSAIVSGNIPIANGISFDIKRKKLNNHVWCWIGDMTSETGCFHENYEYSLHHNLPITWIVEDNNKSVCSDTRRVWNKDILSYRYKSKILTYRYESKYPHAGPGGERIQF